MQLRLAYSISIAIACLLVFKQASASSIQNGKISLNELDEAISLNGQWRFFPGVFLDPTKIEALKEKHNVFVEVPGLWTQTLFKQKPELLGQVHYGSYLLELELRAFDDQVLALDSSLSIFASKIQWARLGVDGLRVETLEVGRPSEQAELEKPWLLDPLMKLPLDANDSKYFLIYHVSSWQTVDGGIFVAPRLLKYESARADRTLRFYQRYFFLGSFLMAFLVNIMFFWNRSKDRASFWLSLVCILASVRLLATENMLEPWFDSQSDSWVFFFNITFRNIAVLVGASGFLNFCFWSFPGSIEKWQIKLLWLLNGSYALFCILAPLSWVEYLWLPAIFLNLGVVVFIMMAVAMALSKQLTGAYYLVASIFVILLGAVHDYFVFSKVYEFPYLFDVATAAFLFFNTRVVGLRFAKALHHSEAMVELLEEHEVSRSEFFRNISSELRTPLQGILGVLDLSLNQAYGELSPVLKSRLDMTRSMVRSLKEQLGRIVDLAKARENELSLDVKHCDINAIVEMVDERGRKLLASHAATSFSCSRRWADEQSPQITTDPSKVTIILQELVENAFRYKHPDQPNHIEVVFSYSSEDGLGIRIKDTGKGIPRSEVAKILEGFRRLSEDEYAASEGLGIGLSLAYNLTKLLKGEFELNSTLAAFTEISLSLPSLDEAILGELELAEKSRDLVSKDRWRLEEFLKEQGLQGKAARALISKARAKACVFVCEDHQISRDLMHQTVDYIGYEVEAFESAEQMLNRLNEDSVGLPDLILLDLIMPGMSGADVLKIMRRDRRLNSISVILLTARSAREDEIMGLELAVDDYLAKPFSVEELILRIDKVIERQHLLQQRIEHEQHVEAAMVVQKSLLPVTQEFDRFKIASFYRASEQVGGDWFHYHYDEKESRFYAVIGDVTGHGIASALLTAAAAGGFRAFFSFYEENHFENLTVENKLLELAKTMNKAILSIGASSSKMMTMAFICIDERSDKIVYTNAGHERIFISSSDKVAPLLVAGSPLGFSENPILKTRVKDFKPGDRVLLLTDGLVEDTIFDRQQQAFQAITAVLGQPNNVLSDVINLILAEFQLDLKKWSREDDLSILLIERHRSSLDQSKSA